MDPNTSLNSQLIDVNDSVLVVIDIQDSFLEKYPAADSQKLVARVVWQLRVAQLLRVPVVAMAEDIDYAGGLTRAIQEALPPGTKVHNKNAFGLADNPEILGEVNSTKRKTAVLVGVETDVCVCHSALGLLQQGYQVAVVSDAVATTSAADETIGLNRMREAGAVITSVKALYYEWLRSVHNVKQLLDSNPQIEREWLPDTLQL